MIPNPPWPCVDTFLPAVQPCQQPRARQICHIVLYLMAEWDTNFTNPGVCYQYAKGGFLNLGSPHDATLGQRIRQARLDAGLNQKELGDQLGLGQHSISRYEGGARSIPYDILLDLGHGLYPRPRHLSGASRPIFLFEPHTVQEHSHRNPMMPSEICDRLISRATESGLGHGGRFICNFALNAKILVN
jgi:transcriptional regulator with XRE-family HTH domain